MGASLHHDGAVPGKDVLQAGQQSQFDRAIRVTKDQQRRHLLDRAQSLLQVSKVVVALGDTLEQVMRIAPDGSVKIGSSISLLLQGGDGLLWVFRHSP